MPTYTNLNGITSPDQETLLPQLKTNVAEFFNWALLGRGFFHNFSGSTSGSYGGDYTQLRLVNDPNYTTGRVWEGSRINWCWETGVENGYSPTIPSGVYVNNTFYSSSGTGTYAHRINYPLGRVVFNSAISTSSVVRCNHSSKIIQVSTEDQPWTKEIIFNTYRVDQSGSQILGQNRIQMPGLVIGTVPNRNMIGREIGGGHWVDQELYFFAYAETPWDRDKLIDIVSFQHQKTIIMYDNDVARASGRIPLDMNGFKNNTSGYIYPDLVAAFQNRKIYFKDVRVSEVTNQAPFFKAILRCNLEVDMRNIP